MPAVRQPTVVFPVSTFGMGHGDSISTRLAFPGSPIYDGTLSNDEQVRATFENPPELGEDDVINDGGYAFGRVPRHYNDAPKMGEVEVGGGGRPGSPWGPNVASPNNTLNPATIPAEGVVATNRVARPGRGFGVGDGLASPYERRTVRRRIGDALELGRGTSLGS